MFVSEVQISFKLPSETLEAGVPAEEKWGRKKIGRNLGVTKETAPEVSSEKRWGQGST